LERFVNVRKVKVKLRESRENDVVKPATSTFSGTFFAVVPSSFARQ